MSGPRPDHQKQLEENRAEHERVKKRILADEDLTTEAKQRKLQETHEHFSTQHKRLVDERIAHEKQQRERLEREVFSPDLLGVSDPAQRVAIQGSYRQALREVREVREPHKLREVLSEAQRTGDTHLARAAFKRAHDLNISGVDDMAGVLNQYLESDPQAARRYQELKAAQPDSVQAAKARLFQNVGPQETRL
jgi:hypothetical protein